MSEIKNTNICTHCQNSECHLNHHNHGKCEFIGLQELCQNFEGNYEYLHNEWVKQLQNEVAKMFPYETEETCPIVLNRIMKNKCIDCVRAGYIKGYIQGLHDGSPIG